MAYALETAAVGLEAERDNTEIGRAMAVLAKRLQRKADRLHKKADDHGEPILTDGGRDGPRKTSR